MKTKLALDIINLESVKDLFYHENRQQRKQYGSINYPDFRTQHNGNSELLMNWGKTVSIDNYLHRCESLFYFKLGKENKVNTSYWLAKARGLDKHQRIFYIAGWQS